MGGAVLFWWPLRFFAVFVLSALFLREWTGDRFMPVRLFTYFAPWFLIALLLALAASLVARRWETALLLMLPLTPLFLSYAPLFATRPPSAPSPEGAFTVMSFNVWSKNGRIDEIAALISEERPDIVLLQEVAPERYPQLLLALKDLYPGEKPHAAFAPELMQVVVSRFPLERCDAYRTKGQAQRVVVKTPRADVTVFNVHPLRRGDWTHRHGRLARLLAEEVLPLEGAVIVAGDFNTTEGSQIYRLLTKHLADAHREGGRGFGFTFPAAGAGGLAGIPVPGLVRIDHIFCNGRLKVHRAVTLPRSAGSDHRPVVAELFPAFPPAPDPPSPPPAGEPVICIERD